MGRRTQRGAEYSLQVPSVTSLQGSPLSVSRMVIANLIFFFPSFFTGYDCCLQDAVSIARAEEEAKAASRKLTETAYTRGSADNITCLVVKFHHGKRDPMGPVSPQDDQEATVDPMRVD